MRKRFDNFNKGPNLIGDFFKPSRIPESLKSLIFLMAEKIH